MNKKAYIINVLFSCTTKNNEPIIYFNQFDNRELKEDLLKMVQSGRKRNSVFTPLLSPHS